MSSFFKNILPKIYQEYNLNKVAGIFSIFGIILLIFDLGFTHLEDEKLFLKNLYYVVISAGFLIVLIRSLIPQQTIPKKVLLFDWILSIVFGLLILIKIDFIIENFNFLQVFNHMGWIYLVLCLFFIREVSSFKVNFKKEYLNPAQLFVGSFLLIIFLGTLLLLLPKATHSGIGLIDALFTSTSAVCVTGLIVVDTGSYFTTFGQTVIMILIQLGGLGIMTFASYFSYFFRGNTSYANQLMLKDISNSEKIGEVFVVLKNIAFNL